MKRVRTIESLERRGAVSTAISLHTGDAALKPQVQLDDVLANAALFLSLDKLHRDGIFGMRQQAFEDGPALFERQSLGRRLGDHGLNIVGKLNDRGFGRAAAIA